MAGINLTKQDFQSLSENVPRVKLSNMYVVENPLSLAGYSYIPRPTLRVFSDFEQTPIRGIWFQATLGKTVLYVVAANSLYTVDTLTGVGTFVGTIPGSDLCTFASTIYSIAITSNGALYLSDGASVSSVSIPDDQQVTDVTSLDNYFIVGIKDTNKFYWISPGDTVIDPLSFTSAERNPDDIISVTTIGDELWVVGQSTAEVFADSGDADAPFVRISGRAYQIGCADKHSVVKTLKDTLPCLIWVTPSKEVVLAQGVPNKISNEAIEELLKESSNFVAWSFRTNRHDFYVLTTDTVTLVYDITADLWYRWSTYLKNTWDAVSGIHVNDTVYCISSSGTFVYVLDYSTKDPSNDYLVCEVSGFIPNESSQPQVCNNITLFLNYGFSPAYSYSPVIELKWSDDGGYTWSNYIHGATGAKGLYDTNISFRSLGRIVQPGRHIELRFSELQSFRLDGATFND